MNGFQVKQHLDLILTWTSTKASITAWKNKKKKKKKNQPRCELTLNERLCGQNQTVTLFHLTSVWMGPLSLAWFDIISCILSNNVTSKWEFENTMQI